MNTDKAKTQAIVFYCKKCDNLIFAVVQNKIALKGSTREINKLLKQGNRMEQISVEEVRKKPFCMCEE